MSRNILNEICERKRQHIEACKSNAPLSEINARLEEAQAPRGFTEALRNHDKPAIIAEIKKASPSKGLIRVDFNHSALAKAYEAGGAACLSVLTDEPYFQGHDSYLAQARDACSLPVLRKDFMLDTYQIYESRALGADCILLIMAALTDDDARRLHELSAELGMDVLVEVHDAPELERALTLKPTMIGINNRNLKTLEIDVQTSITLAKSMPENCLRISESGIYAHDDILRLEKHGFDGFLVGESLMKQANVTAALQQLRGKT